MSEGRTAVVTAGEYIDRSLPTASWWDKYELIPGEYAVELYGYHGQPLRAGEAPVEARVRVAAILRESYRVNRLFTASSSEHTRPERSTFVTFTVGRGLPPVGERGIGDTARVTYAEAPALLGYAAVADGGRNVYRFGQRCMDCDDTFDPMRKTGRPCVRPYAHAFHAVESWRWTHNDPQRGRIEAVRAQA